MTAPVVGTTEINGKAFGTIAYVNVGVDIAPHTLAVNGVIVEVIAIPWADVIVVDVYADARL